jgi:hypothetical protein
MLGRTGVTRFLSCSALIVAAACIASAQHRVRTPPPNELLQALDKADRDCVMTNGGLNKAVRLQSIQLAADGTSQLLVKGSTSCLCGAQNCSFWIYRKEHGKYKLLLAGPGAIKIKAGKNLAGGYRDVISQSHASANETILRTYRFDGKEYRLTRCESRAYNDDKGKPTKAPLSRPCSGV